jgi:K+-sensing histidine kinase KdpD
VAPRTYPDPPRRILLASTGAPFPKAAIDKAVELATPEHAKITVLSIAKVFGTSLGLPHPGLQPTAAEWNAQLDIVENTAAELRGLGFEVRSQAARSRNAPKMIAKWANARHFHAIVIADAFRPTWRVLIEGDLKKEINRRCDVPVHAVKVPALVHGSAGPDHNRR